MNKKRDCAIFDIQEQRYKKFFALPLEVFLKMNQVREKIQSAPETIFETQISIGSTNPVKINPTMLSFFTLWTKSKSRR
jgi:hypothetical protein